MFQLLLLNVPIASSQCSNLNSPFYTSSSAEESMRKAINDYVKKVLNRDEFHIS